MQLQHTAFALKPWQDSRVDASFGANGGVGRVQAAGTVVQEAEHQAVQHGERGMTDGAPMPAGLMRNAIEAGGTVPQLHHGPLRHSGKSGSGAARPYRERCGECGSAVEPGGDGNRWERGIMARSPRRL